MEREREVERGGEVIDGFMERIGVLGRKMIKAWCKGAEQMETWENNIYKTTQETKNKTARRQIKVTVQTKERPEETQRTGSKEDKVLENAMTVALQRFGFCPARHQHELLLHLAG